MALVTAAEGTQTATVSTEHTLSTKTDAGTYVLVVDCGNLANGDVVELYLYTKVRSTSTERLAFSATYAHAQIEPNKYSIPVPSEVSIKATLKQTVGTGRSFDWKLLTL
jgi:hypothetical protein